MTDAMTPLYHEAPETFERMMWELAAPPFGVSRQGGLASSGEFLTC